MNELAFIKQKFGDRDFIEINHDTVSKVISWLVGNKIAPYQVDVRKVLSKLINKGFIKFLNKGVIVSKVSLPNTWYSVYPFEFTDYDTAIASIYITDPDDKISPHPLHLMCKVEIRTDASWKIIENTNNVDLAARHVADEIAYMNNTEIGRAKFEGIIKYMRDTRPDLKPDSQEFENELAKEYLSTIIRSQVIVVLGVNAYLALLEKEILITKIRQDRSITASNGSKKKNNNTKRVAYRYIIDLPPNYVPRKANWNYLVSQWNRAGHHAIRWVRKENVDSYTSACRLRAY